MVRRRHTFLLALLLVSVGILYLTVTQSNRTFNSLYPQFIPLDFRIPIKDNSPPRISTTAPDSNNCSGGSVMYENFCVTSPYDNELKNTSSEGLITLCTQGTVEFLQHIVVLCHRWSAPISVAVYSPPDDWTDAHILVNLLRQCDSCVRYWVNWHFIFPKDEQLPPVDSLQLSRECSSVTQQTKRPKKRRSQGTYPINVGRNVARALTRTPFVFSIDIELYPSLHIPQKFERMLRSQASGADNQVWVLPVFEVHSRFRAPLIKPELRSMFVKKQAISFHQYRCNICHRIPNLTQWITHGEGTTSEVEDSLEPLKVWTTVKRSRRFKLHEWEPFFIGTTKDPEFDIRLSWEGKQNKMQMAYEMCIRNYDFNIVENAFLVHTPGINVYNATKEKEREKHYSHNRKVMASVKRDLSRKYGSKNDC